MCSQSVTLGLVSWEADYSRRVRTCGEAPQRRDVEVVLAGTSSRGASIDKVLRDLIYATL